MRKYATYDYDSVDGGLDGQPEEVSEQSEMDDDSERDEEE